jgi:hypothetical protein
MLYAPTCLKMHKFYHFSCDTTSQSILRSVPLSYVHALECFISAKQEFLSQGTSSGISALSTLYDHQRKYDTALLKQLPPGTVPSNFSLPLYAPSHDHQKSTDASGAFPPPAFASFMMQQTFRILLSYVMMMMKVQARLNVLGLSLSLIKTVRLMCV